MNNNFFLIPLLTLCFGCSSPAQNGAPAINYTSFYDIPGLTREEANAVEALKEKVAARGKPLILSNTHNTEAFVTVDGGIGGFTPLFAEWLTNLFGIPFVVEIHELNEMLTGMLTGEIDFGTNAYTEERKLTYYLTEPHTYRTLKIMRIHGSLPPHEIARMRPVRYAFLHNATQFNVVSELLPSNSFVPVFAETYDEMYHILEDGEADAMIVYNTTEASFDMYGGVIVEDFLPLSVNPISLTAGVKELEPVISVVTKALNGGAYNHLTNLYRDGYQEYRKNKFFTMLTEEERAFIRRNSVIPFASQYLSYPISFYNQAEGKWEGIAFDIVNEIGILTGLDFKITHEPSLTSAACMALMEAGDAYFMPYLIQTNERMDPESPVLWSQTHYMSDYYALLSKQGFPNIELNDVSFNRVGYPGMTSFAEMFKTWFPNALYAKEYPNTDAAFMALEKGEIDLVMINRSRLTAMTNYYELSDYKANFVFDVPFYIHLGFNKEMDVLRSIVDKALPLINTHRIVDQWMSKTYNFEAMRLRQQHPWLIGAIGLASCVIFLIVVLLARSRNVEKHLEKLVAQRTNELKTASEAKSKFLATMSHEIRTPMNVILGITNSRLMSESLPQKEKESYEKIFDSGHLLLGIINDILDLSKIEAGKFELVPVKYNVLSLINDTANMCVMQYSRKQIKFKLSVDENIPLCLYGDDLRVKQVLNNLLSNAFKYTNAGEVELRFNCEWPAENKTGESKKVKLIIRVSDTGQGMTREQVSRLFTDEYTRFNLEANRATVGTGLGMTITGNLVKMMNGDISVESAPGKGSVFTVSLPQEVTDTEALGRETAKDIENFNFSGVKREQRTKIKHEPMPYGKVLIVDDMISNLDVALLLMKLYKLQADTAESGFEALDIIKSGKKYDIVFMDHMMPRMDGMETTRKIREEGYAGTIIALTANAVAGQQETFLANGFDDFISKPIDLRQLDEVLHRYVRNRGKSPESPNLP